MKRVAALVIVVVLLALIGANTSSALADSGSRRFGHVTLFDRDAPTGSHIRANISGQTCGESEVDLRDPDHDADLEIMYDFHIAATADPACTAEGAEIEFLWYRDDPSVMTTCTPTGATSNEANVRVDIVCGVEGEFGAVWIVENNTDEAQRALEIFPRVVVGDAGVGVAPAACGQAAPSAQPAGLFLRDHVEFVWQNACVAPGESVRLGLSTDCPCHSELEIERFVWLDEPLFKANVDCDRDVDAADALRDLLIAAGEAVTQIEDCPTGSGGHYYPDALGGVWGDINCDSQVTVLDVINILRTAERLPSGIDANCRAQYGVYN